MIGFLITIGGMALVAVVGIVLAWHKGYHAGRLDGLADQSCRMGQAARVIKKELDWATNWSSRDSLHDITDLED